MAQLRQDYPEFQKRQAEVIVVGPESPAEFSRYWQENDLPYQGLPDPSHSILKMYGQQVSLFKLGRMPAQVIIDRHGRARYVHYGKSMQDIPSSQELFGILDELNREDAAAPRENG